MKWEPWGGNQGPVNVNQTAGEKKVCRRNRNLGHGKRGTNCDSRPRASSKWDRRKGEFAGGSKITGWTGSVKKDQEDDPKGKKKKHSNLYKARSRTNAGKE